MYLNINFDFMEGNDWTGFYTSRVVQLFVVSGFDFGILEGFLKTIELYLNACAPSKAYMVPYSL